MIIIKFWLHAVLLAGFFSAKNVLKKTAHIALHITTMYSTKPFLVIKVSILKAHVIKTKQN